MYFNETDCDMNENGAGLRTVTALALAMIEHCVGFATREM
jgi:hypothetical protein